MDPRYIILARNLTSHSTNIQPNESVLIHAFDIPDEIARTVTQDFTLQQLVLEIRKAMQLRHRQIELNSAQLKMQ